jgi:hypothetical protein
MGLVFENDLHDEFGTWPVGYTPFGGPDFGEIRAVGRAVGSGDDKVFYEAWSQRVTGLRRRQSRRRAVATDRAHATCSCVRAHSMPPRIIRFTAPLWTHGSWRRSESKRRRSTGASSFAIRPSFRCGYPSRAPRCRPISCGLRAGKGDPTDSHPHQRLRRVVSLRCNDTSAIGGRADSRKPSAREC